MSALSPPIDARIEIVTAENIAFHYVLAGPFHRLPAYLIDCAICVAVVFMSLLLAALALPVLGGLGMGMWFIATFVLSWFYFGLFEVYWNGQTPGKRMMGLRVLTVDGTPLNALQAILRNILRAVDALPVVGFNEAAVPFYMAALTTMTLNRRYQRLGDLACGTIVVLEQDSRWRGVMPVGDDAVRQLANTFPPRFVASRGLTLALAMYVSKRPFLGPLRRAELARTLSEPLAERLGLSRDADPDLLLCAAYFRVYSGEDATSTSRAARRMATGGTPSTAGALSR